MRQENRAGPDEPGEPALAPRGKFAVARQPLQRNRFANVTDLPTDEDWAIERDVHWKATVRKKTCDRWQSYFSIRPVEEKLAEKTVGLLRNTTRAFARTSQAAQTRTRHAGPLASPRSDNGKVGLVLENRRAGAEPAFFPDRHVVAKRHINTDEAAFTSARVTQSTPAEGNLP